MWQELFISLLIQRPVYSLQILHIELIVYLLPNMIKNVSTFTTRLIVEERFKCNRRCLTTGYFNFLHTSTGTHKDILTFLIGQQRTTSDTFQQNLC